MGPSHVPHEPTLTVRFIWPLIEFVGADPRGSMLLAEIGLTPEELADRDARIPCRAALRGIERLIETFGDPLLGLKLGARLSLDVFDVVEHAACSTDNLGTAIAVMSRYVRVLTEACSVSVSIEGDLAHLWQSWLIPAPPAANDLIIMASLRFSQRVCQTYEPPLEIRLAHAKPSYADAYQEYFGVPVRFDAPANVIVMKRERLSMPLKRRNPQISAAFERKAQAIARAIDEKGGVADRVKHELHGQLSQGSASMKRTALRLDTSVATLRRKLEEEGTSFAALLEQVRREAAQRYLSKAEPTLTEVAFLLGFSDLRSFSRAFRRWTGMTPSEFRTAGGQAKKAVLR